MVYDISNLAFPLPTLTLQPIRRKRGCLRRDETKKGGTVKISTRETDTAFIVSIEDDGAGIDPMRPHDDGRTHIGIKNVRDRLARMSGGTLDIESEPGEGTLAVITIPKDAAQKIPPPNPPDGK